MNSERVSLSSLKQSSPSLFVNIGRGKMQSARTNLTANWHKPEEHLISCRSSDLIPNLSMKDEHYVLLFIITDRTTGQPHGHYRNNAVFC